MNSTAVLHTSRTNGPVVAILPARGGSKGIHRKNLQCVGGVPLLARSVRTALAADEIDGVYVSTEDPEIAAVAVSAGAEVIARPADLAGDTASSESALVHALHVLDDRGVRPTVVVMMQVTSPFVRSVDLDAAVRQVRASAADCVFSATQSHAFLWRNGIDGADGVNHDRSVRLRRQDRQPEFRETGAFYVMDAAGFQRVRHRFFGRVAMQEVDPTFSIEIDDQADLDVARAIAPLFDTRALTPVG